MTVEASVADVQNVDDISIYLNRPDALESLGQILQEATSSRPLLQRLSQNLIKTYTTTPEVLTFFLGLDWRERDTSFYSTYREVLLNLASIQPASISLILHTLVSRLVVRREQEPELAVDTRTLDAICDLIKLMPAASRLLMVAIEFHFPFHMRSVAEHVSFVSNILELAARISSWRFKIVELVICKALVIDVELQNYDDLATDKDQDTDEDRDTDKDRDTDEVNKDDPNAERRRKAKEFRDKLDRIMLIVLEHLVKFMDGEEQSKRLVFSFLLGVFEKSVLTTFKAKNLQFLLFYMISIAPELADDFLGLLFRPLVKFCEGLDKGMSAVPTTSLLSSLAYIGSFVARCQFLSPELLQLAFQVLSNLSLRLLNKASCSVVGILPIISLQHLMYIFTARHEQIVAMFGEDELMDLFDVLFLQNEESTFGIEETAAMRLLLHCHQPTVERFIELAERRLGLLDPGVSTSFAQLKRRNQQRRLSTRYEDFESYFPFDPIRLPLFRDRFIMDSLYNNYDDFASGTASSRPSL